MTAALDAFASGRGSEHAALTALAASRLLVPVVAVLSGEPEPGGQPGRAPHAAAAPGEPGTGEDGHEGTGRNGGPGSGPAGRRRPGQGHKASEMAMPTLVGLDGRRAIPAFTCTDAMRAWQADARPVPAPARRVWQAAVGDSCAVVIDVAGPVRLAVEGARLAALARGDAAPAPWADPDVRDAVAEALAGELAIAGFELRPDTGNRDVVIALRFAPDCAGADLTAVAAEAGSAVMARLGGRLRRGVAIWLGGST